MTRQLMQQAAGSGLLRLSIGESIYHGPSLVIKRRLTIGCSVSLILYVVTIARTHLSQFAGK
jgi:hypothetical protein